MGSGYDLAMKQQFNGKERTIEDWKELFTQVDPSFRLVRNVSPPRSMLSIIEFSWEPEL